MAKSYHFFFTNFQHPASRFLRRKLRKNDPCHLVQALRGPIAVLSLFGTSALVPLVKLWNYRRFFWWQNFGFLVRGKGCQSGRGFRLWVSIDVHLLSKMLFLVGFHPIRMTGLRTEAILGVEDHQDECQTMVGYLTLNDGSDKRLRNLTVNGHCVPVADRLAF